MKTQLRPQRAVTVPSDSECPVWRGSTNAACGSYKFQLQKKAVHHHVTRSSPGFTSEGRSGEGWHRVTGALGRVMVTWQACTEANWMPLVGVYFGRIWLKISLCPSLPYSCIYGNYLKVTTVGPFSWYSCKFVQTCTLLEDPILLPCPTFIQGSSWAILTLSLGSLKQRCWLLGRSGGEGGHGEQKTFESFLSVWIQQSFWSLIVRLNIWQRGKNTLIYSEIRRN